MATRKPRKKTATRKSSPKRKPAARGASIVRGTGAQGGSLKNLLGALVTIDEDTSILVTRLERQHLFFFPGVGSWPMIRWFAQVTRRDETGAQKTIGRYHGLTIFVYRFDIQDKPYHHAVIKDPPEKISGNDMTAAIDHKTVTHGLPWSKAVNDRFAWAVTYLNMLPGPR